MKKFYFVFCSLLISIPIFSQQFLWSTGSDTSSKHVELEDVSNEILKFYDHYQFYFDGAGYNKDTFFKELGKYGGSSASWNSFKNEVRNIKELTVFAMRANSGKGSEIIVILITKDNVNLLTFSNSYASTAQMCMSYERDKFARWLETLKE